MEYKTQGVCPKSLSFNIINGNVHNVKFDGGCNGNLKAIGKLVEGMSKEKVIELLLGNTCGNRPTSCTDQLARALQEYK